MEIIKRLDEIQAELKKRFNQLIIETEQEAKRYIRENAYDTGDMESAVTSTPAREEGGNLVGEIFVDPNLLYIKRKLPKSGKANRLYPIYVHEGTDGASVQMMSKQVKRYIAKGMQSTGQSSYTKRKSWTINIPPMKARPFFTIAWEKIKTSEDFRNLAKDVLLRHGER